MGLSALGSMGRGGARLANPLGAVVNELVFSPTTVTQGSTVTVTLNTTDYDAEAYSYPDFDKTGQYLLSAGPNVDGGYFQPSADRKVLKLQTLNTHRNQTETIPIVYKGQTYNITATPTGGSGVPSFAATAITNAQISGFNNATIQTLDTWKSVLSSTQSTNELVLTLPAPVTAPFTIEFWGRINTYTQDPFALPLFCSLGTATNQGVGLAYGGWTGYNGGGLFFTSATNVWAWTMLSVDSSWNGYYWIPYWVQNDSSVLEYRYQASINSVSEADRTSYTRLTLLQHSSSRVGAFRSQATAVDYNVIRISNSHRYPETVMDFSGLPDPYNVVNDASTVAIYRFLPDAGGTGL